MSVEATKVSNPKKDSPLCGADGVFSGSQDQRRFLVGHMMGDVNSFPR